MQQSGHFVTQDYNAVVAKLAAEKGLDPRAASQTLHSIKAGVDNNNDVIFTWSGDVYNATSGDWMGNLLHG